MYQRSCDQFLGVPFNIASYALLTHMIAQVIGASVGELIMVFGDSHIYMDHIPMVKEQLTREAFPLPSLWINPTITDIDGFTMNDFRLDNYQHHPEIKAKMSV
jgi:thymidylate synthase